MRMLLVIQAIGYFAVAIGFFAAVAQLSPVLVIAGLVGGYLLLGCSWFLRRRLPSGYSSDRAA